MDRFARLCEDVARSPSRNRKIELTAGYFRSLNDDDLARAVRFLSAQPVPKASGRRLSVGGAILRDAALSVSGISHELLRLCNREVGDTAETIALLMRNAPGNAPLTLAAAEAIYEELSSARRTAVKQKILDESLRAYPPAVLKYFLKIITGSLRIGLQEKLVEEALAAACEVPAETVRGAANRSGDLPAVAVALRSGQLEHVEARLFHPMDFMLARPLDDLSMLPDPDQWWVEDKFDGIRCQAHCSGGKVKLFSRGSEDVTDSYPDLVVAFSSIPQPVILDGELLAWQNDAPLPFNVLQQRLARKRITSKMLAEIPVAFVAYDLLYEQDRLVLDESIEDRRIRLETLFLRLKHPLRLSRQLIVTSTDQLNDMFRQARERGNEGLVLKRRGSAYEAGKRGGNWLKIKRPYATLDVVITAAEQGRGRRATMLSDYTFAVRDGDRYLNVGKAYSGLTDEEIRELTRLLRSLATERYGRVLLVKPQVVLEVAFDGVQRSPRHKSGYAMRFPRIVRWRHDKPAEEADTLDRVQELYEASLRRP